jgi:hypothetical protein
MARRWLKAVHAKWTRIGVLGNKRAGMAIMNAQNPILRLHGSGFTRTSSGVNALLPAATA